MDESLFRRAKLESVRQGRPFSAILEAALAAYLSNDAGHQASSGSLVAASWGAFALPLEVVRAVMEEEDDWLDS